MVPARRLATGIPVLLDRLSLAVVQIAPRQPVEVEGVVAVVVAVAVKVVTVRITGGGTLTVRDRTIRMSHSSTRTKSCRGGSSRPRLCKVLID